MKSSVLPWMLTHCDLVTGWYQSITWTNADLLSTAPSGINFSECSQLGSLNVLNTLTKGAFTPNAERVRPRVQVRFPCEWSVYTGAGLHTVSVFVEAPFHGIGSLIYKYWPISAPYSCGSCRRIASWAIYASARSGPTTEAQWTRGSVNSTTQFLQTDPLRMPASRIRMGTPHVSRVGVNAPLLKSEWHTHIYMCVSLN